MRSSPASATTWPSWRSARASTSFAFSWPGSTVTVLRWSWRSVRSCTLTTSSARKWQLWLHAPSHATTSMSPAAVRVRSAEELRQLARQADPAVSEDELQAAMMRLDRLDDSLFIDLYGPSKDEVDALRATFADWPGAYGPGRCW